MKLIEPSFTLSSQIVQSNSMTAGAESSVVSWLATVTADFEAPVEASTFFEHQATGSSPARAMEALLADLEASGIEL